MRGPGASNGPPLATGRPWGPPTGIRILVPGLPQWSWSQRGRAGVLLGSYLSAIGVGLFAWGTLAGSAMLAFAFCSHVVSAADVVRQRAFPGFGRWVPVVSASAGLGLGYAPLLGSLWMVAWPEERGDAPGVGYLVNRWAYHRAHPEPGDRVWYECPDQAGPRIGMVVARHGQEAEWFEGQIVVEGQPLVAPRSVQTLDGGWTHLILRVPAGYLLVAATTDESDGQKKDEGPILIESSCVRGRVWAQHAPIWERRFLH